MRTTARIALVGDYRPNVTAHVAIPKALAASSSEPENPVEIEWISTERLDRDAPGQLQFFEGVWCVPASPYASMQGALDAIRFARESGRPFLGTCGGFQHAVIEYARNVLGLVDSAHAEIDPDADTPLIAPLSCAMIERDGEIAFHPGTRLREIYGVERATETYHCSYGFNPRCAGLFAGSEMIISAVNSRGEPHAIELPSHRFFMATAFQPERSGLRGAPHALIAEFIRAVRNRAPVA